MLISFICSNQEMRISSFILTAKDYSDEINVIGYDCNDNTKKYVEKLGYPFYQSSKNTWFSNITKEKASEGIIIINLDKNMSLDKLNHILNLDVAELADINIVLNNNNKSKKSLNKKEKIIKNIKDFENISWIYLNKNGFEKYLSDQKLSDFDGVTCELDLELNQKNVILKKSIISNIKGRKNPLIIFGIPGLIMILSSFILVYNVIGRYDSIDSISMGTAVVTIGTTVLGILSLMSAIISYIIGKQTEFILTNYSE